MLKVSSAFVFLFAGLPALAQTEPVLKFSGYADLRLTNLQYDEKSNVSGAPESGFGLEDGAFYLNYQNQNIEFVLDIPFRRAKDLDRTAQSTDTASNGPNFLFGAEKAQAYGKIKSEFGADLTIGQFDTLYGVELNDSKDRFFSKTGLVYDKLLPVTHMGLMANYNLSGFAVKGLIANPAGKGTLGTSTTEDENFEYGGALAYANEIIRGQVGYISRGIQKTNGEADGNRSLVDVTLGATWGDFNLDLEYASLMDDSKNSLTASATDKEDAGTGALALLTYKVTEKMTLGARYEVVENDPAMESSLKISATALGVGYKWSDAFQSKVDAIQYETSPVGGGENRTDNRIAISSLFFF